MVCRIRLDALIFWEAYCGFRAMLQNEYAQVPRDAACMCRRLRDELSIRSVTSLTVHSVMLRFAQGAMWRRTSGTYTARMMAFLSETKAFQAGELVMITRKPLRFEAHRCQAHLSLVAEGILKYLEAEFPSTTPQVQILVERYSTTSATCFVLSRSGL